eukprot:m.89474 g.89474  ORF g.89474 m.89474 type:complete len:323 (+) comp26300_c0_seq2:54-1022(+)
MFFDQFFWWAGVSATATTFYCLSRVAFALLKRCDPITAVATTPNGYFKDKTVWITGASSGVGKEMAMQFANHGSNLILSARNKAALETVRSDILKLNSNVKVTVLVIDLNDLNTLPSKIEAALSIHGRVDVLINNAGVSQRALSADTLFEVEQQLININYLAGVRLAKGVLPSMHKSGKGLIVNIISVAGKIGVPLRTAYCGSKFAMFGFFDALRFEEWQAETGVSVTNVALGSTRTSIALNAARGDGQRRGESDANIEAGMTPTFVVDRIIAAGACDVEEVWVAQGLELLGMYLMQYVPVSAKKALKGKLKEHTQRAMKTE